MWRERGSRLSVGWTWKCHWQGPRHGWAGRGGTRGSLDIYRLTGTIPTAPVSVSTRRLSGLLWKKHGYFYFFLFSECCTWPQIAFGSLCLEPPVSKNSQQKPERGSTHSSTLPWTGQTIQVLHFFDQSSHNFGLSRGFHQNMPGDVQSVWCQGIFVTVFSKRLKMKGWKWRKKNPTCCTEKLQKFWILRAF